jgi:uncharacterized delta-60 repeat protein
VIAEAGSTPGPDAASDASDGSDAADVYDGPTGMFDPTFGNGGIVDLSYPLDSGAYAYANAIAIDSKQRIVVAGASTPDGLTDMLEAAVVRVLPDGTPDPSFAHGGPFLNNFGLGDTHRAGGVAVEPDDSLLVSGFYASSIGGFFVAHLDSTGTLDPGFGDPGGVLQAPSFAAEDSAYPIVLQPNGFLVGGWEGQSTTFSMALWRYDLTGALDMTFGTSGETRVPFGTGEEAELRSLGVQSSGRIVSAGWVFDAATYRYQAAVVRYTASGNLDTTFGMQGIATSGQSVTSALVVQPDDRIVLAGRSTQTGSGPALVWRLLPDGSPDTTFGTNGQTSMAFGAYGSDAVGIALQRDGRIVVVGDDDEPGGGHMVLFRLTPGGAADPEFSTVSSSGSITAGAVTIQADGKLLAVGTRGDGQLELWRLE